MCVILIVHLSSYGKSICHITKWGDSELSKVSEYQMFPNWPLTVGNLLIIFSSLNENVTLSLTLSGDVLPVIHTAGNNNNNNSYTQWSLD